jgi:hypothetical protein
VDYVKKKKNTKSVQEEERNEEKLSLRSGHNMYTTTLDLRDNLEIQELD